MPSTQPNIKNPKSIRICKLPNSKPNIICKSDIKNISAFIYDLAAFEWSRVALFDDVELVLEYFYEEF